MNANMTITVNLSETVQEWMDWYERNKAIRGISVEIDALLDEAGEMFARQIGGLTPAPKE